MIEFRLLGSVDLRGSEGQPLRSVLAQPKRVALLAFLTIARPNGYHRRDKLLGLFWSERDQERGRGALRKALHFLRQSLGQEAILGRGDEEIGVAKSVVWCDAVAFEEALEAGKQEEALELYRGDLLEGFFLSEAPEFERWLEGERERLRVQAAEAAWTLAEHNEAEENSVQAARWARKAVSLSPDDEGGFRRLLELLDRVGDRAGAMKEYEMFARRLQEEYEGAPSPETQTLIATIRERELAAAGGSRQRPVDSQTGEARTTSERAIDTPRPAQQAEPRPLSLFRVLTSYALVSLAVLVAVHMFTLQLGLPDWVFPSAVVALLVGLPIIVATALVQGAAIPARHAGGAKAGPRSAVQRWFTWPKAILGGVLAFALPGIVVGGYMAMRVMGIGPLGTLIAKRVLEERDLIVLADFEDRTGDSTLALTVTEAMRVMLEQSPVVRVADDDYVGRVLQRMERDAAELLRYDLAREVAIRDGLKAVVAGQINPAGSGYVVSARLVAAETGATLGSFLETAADSDAIIPALDRLSRRLRERIGESLRTIQRTPPLRELRTASLEALRLTTEAQRAIPAGESRRAVDLQTRAIEIDTAFAEAYRGRAIALFNLGEQPAQQIADITRAYELRHREPLSERYHTEALYHEKVTGDRDKAIDAYRRVLELKPDDAGALNNLGLNYFWMRDYTRAEEVFRRRLDVDSLGGPSWYNLARTLFDRGRFDEAWETLRQWEAKMPEHLSIPYLSAVFASVQGDYEAAEVYLRRWRDLRPEDLGRRAHYNRSMARLVQLRRGRLAEAERHFRDAMAVYEEGDGVADYIVTVIELAVLDLWFRADTIRALQAVADAVEKYPLDSIDPLERPYAGLAGFYAFAGEPGRARKLLEEWEAAVPPELRRTWEATRRLEWGAVAMAEGQAADALDHFRYAQERNVCPTCVLPLLAQAYALAGQPDSTVAMYERYLTTPSHFQPPHFPALDGGSPAGGWQHYWLPVAYERLGDLYEQRRDAAKAILYYGGLVDMWKNADPELQPRVQAARRAVEALSTDH